MFTNTIGGVRKGALIDELSVKLQELTIAVRKAGRPGRLLLTLDLKPASVGDDTTLIIEDDVSIKLPKPQRARTIMFSTEDGQLLRKDPRQAELELREVPDEAPKEIRKVVNN
jgi:hypothetical protein